MFKKVRKIWIGTVAGYNYGWSIKLFFFIFGKSLRNRAAILWTFLFSFSPQKRTATGMVRAQHTAGGYILLIPELEPGLSLRHGHGPVRKQNFQQKLVSPTWFSLIFDELQNRI